VADSAEQSTASTPTKLGSGPSQEVAVGSGAAPSSGPDEVARVLARLRALVVPDDIDGNLTTFEPDRTMLAAASLLERLTADLAAMTAKRDAAYAAGRAAGMDECAKVCRALGDKIVKRLEGLSEDMGDYSKARAWDYMQCAIAIRALVEGNAPPEGRG